LARACRQVVPSARAHSPRRVTKFTEWNLSDCGNRRVATL
jgi:hypothetical protein